MEEEAEEVVMAKGVAEEGQNEDNLAEVAFSWVSQNHLHWVKQGGLALPLCPSGWHGLEMVNAFMEAGVDRLLEAIDKAHVAESRDGSVDLKLSDQLLH